MCIDGGYSLYALQGSEKQRIALGAPVTRHEFSSLDPVNSQDDVVAYAAGVLHTRIHALIGTDNSQHIDDPKQYAKFVVALIRRYGVGGSFWKANSNLDGKKFAIRSFELMNEPYLGYMTATAYAQRIKPALLAVKKA